MGAGKMFFSNSNLKVDVKFECEMGVGRGRDYEREIC